MKIGSAVLVTAYYGDFWRERRQTAVTPVELWRILRSVNASLSAWSFSRFWTAAFRSEWWRFDKTIGGPSRPVPRKTVLQVVDVIRLCLTFLAMARGVSRQDLKVCALSLIRRMYYLRYIFASTAGLHKPLEP